MDSVSYFDFFISNFSISNFSLFRTKILVPFDYFSLYLELFLFTEQTERKCSIFENSNVIKTFEIQKFDLQPKYYKGFFELRKLDVPKNTISSWMKNKDKLFEGLEQSSSDTKKIPRCDYEQVDKAVFKWFSIQRSQNVSIDGPILKEKVLQFAKSVNFPTFKASDEWLDKWKKR